VFQNNGLNYEFNGDFEQSKSGETFLLVRFFNQEIMNVNLVFLQHE
jgi:hypothetical protein